ncbi:MAG: restriction endonuclease subunit R [Betaproteobacteria bacterium RBG_16_64_18]|nr:MAG: restriction endonuclease subunit R [Betaproteobacteria bacterium RBG_16_64_18]
MPRKQKRDPSNPILNSPYEDPGCHYATDQTGNLNYDDIRDGRRVFTPDTPTIPMAQAQPGMFDINELARDYQEHLINLLRREVGGWRQAKYPGVTSRVTRDLLDYWFLNPAREDRDKLFFAQQEAVETAIWLNEIAERSNAGTHVLDRLAQAQRTVSVDAEQVLPRIAFKMATGSGKTVVMACLILYHFLNRRQYRNETRYADDFLVVAPGITIRDRLQVLFVDTSTHKRFDALDYYRQRALVPQQYEDDLDALNARLVVTNYHAFEPRVLSGNKKSPFDGKLDPSGRKREAKEDFNLVAKRVLGKFKRGRRLLILNDEAHHCYLPKAKGRDTEEEASATENERAAVWFTGLTEIARRYQVRATYDLSATPYYLSGSGWPAYSLFPWVVIDFGLIEAIESGLVKIPFLPVEDTSQNLTEPVLRDLYSACKEGLPKKGQETARSEAKKRGEKIVEQPPSLPPTLVTALQMFVANYEKYEAGMRRAGERRLDLFSEPPVFIVVCNNTTVSKEVYKYIAGYEIEGDKGETIAHPGKFDVFSNYDPVTRHGRTKPPTLLIDSDALEYSGQVDAEFRKVFAPEIEEFRRAYRIQHPERSAEDIEDTEILREVVNTVGKRGRLGAHVRCVVSVSMLTEGWDANTVTHIVGLRAFGSNLLCEQVAGRALRRREYFLDPKTGKFPPEYAHIIGVPFKLFKPGTTEYVEPVETKDVRALPERAEKYEIKFPNLVGYRVLTLDAPLGADLKAVEDFELDFTQTPARTVLGIPVGPEKRILNLDQALDLREQEVVFWIVQQLLRYRFRDDEGRPNVAQFAALRRIASDWLRDKVKAVGEIDPRYRKFVLYWEGEKVAAHLVRAIDAYAQAKGRTTVRPLLNHYNPESSTRYVSGRTSKNTWPTKKSHVNVVVADTQSWEQLAAKALDERDCVEAYVKNAYLNFGIPYVKDGKDRTYLPDFIARVRLADKSVVNLIIEVTGMNKDKAEKIWTVENRWLPAVNGAALSGRWDFVEVSDDIRTVKNQLADAFDRVNAKVLAEALGAGDDDRLASQAFMKAQESSMRQFWQETENDKL